MIKRIKESLYIDYAVVKEYIGTILKKDKSYVVLMLLFSLMAAGVTTIDTLLIKYVVDELLLDKSMGKVFPVILLGISCSAILSILQSWIRRRIEYKNIDIVNYFDLRISQKIMTLKYEHIDNPDVLEKKDKALFPVKNQNAIAVFLTDVLNILQAGFSLISLCVILFTLDIWLMLIIFALIVVDVWIYGKVQQAEYEFFEILVEDNRELNYYKSITTDFKYAKDIRLFGFSGFIARKIDAYIDVSTQKFAKANRKIGKYSAYSSVLAVFRTVFAYGYIAYKVFKDLIGIGSFTMYVYAITSFSELFGKVFLSVIEMKQYCKFLYPYFEFEKMESMEDQFGDQTIGDSFEVTFDHVSFRYPNQENYALKNISFTIKDREVVALVGVNGSGKTTIVKLLCGLYRPTEGRVLINGKDISEYDYNTYTDKLAVVFQDYKIFATTVGENVVFDKNIPADKLESILQKVGMLDFVKHLGNAEDTPITKYFNPEGIELSGGMEQRLAIARALVKDFCAIILDEPTSALDPFKENEILSDMRGISSNKTAIFVSHSMSSCKWADKIIVMKDGCVEEIGKHEDLMSRQGEYEKLFSMQASFYA